MKLKIIILSIGAMLFSVGYVIAAQQKGSMIEYYEEEEEVSEVGNKICPISKKPVDVMGEPLQYEYEGKIYNFCCAMCLKTFKKNPEKYIKIIEEMMKEERDK